MAFDFKLLGAKQAARDFRIYGRQLKSRCQDGMVELALEIVEDTQGRLSDQGAIASGELFESYKVTTNGARVRGKRHKKKYYTTAIKAGFVPSASDVSVAPGIAQADLSLNAVVSKPIGAVAGTDAGHAAFVEFGTIKMPARPAFGPAIQAARGKAERLVAKEIRRIRKIAKR